MSDLLPAVDAHTARLVSTARDLDDIAAPSLCTGWTRGHVLSHLARNAEGLARGVRSAIDGTGETIYAGTAERDADIAAGAGRPPAEQVADVERTATALATALRRIAPDTGDRRVERTPGGIRIRIARLPRMRLREVVYHHVDLAAGFTFADVEPDLLELFLDGELRTLASADPGLGITVHTDEGRQWSLGDGAAQVAGPASGVLLWLARGDAAGVRSDRLPELPGGR